MFNKKGESQMFNKKKDEEKNVWLVIEKYGSDKYQTFTVAKKAHSLQDAVAFKFALDKLNDKDYTFVLFNELGQFDIETIEKIDATK